MSTPGSLSTTDFEDVLRINALSIPGVALLDYAELIRLASLQNAHYTVKSADNRIAGYALAFPDHAAYDGEEFQTLRRLCSRPFLYVDQVAVDPSMRRRKVAVSLYKALENEARRAAMTALCCEVNLEPPNPTSVAFHQAMGFHVVEDLETVDKRIVSLMIKRLE